MDTKGYTTPVYLDYNATTPLAPEVLVKINEALTTGWANPGSKHKEGLKAKEFLTAARGSVSRMLHCDPSEIVFTSGATESCNMVLHTAAKCCAMLPDGDAIPHLVISNVEHECVAITAEKLKEEGKIDLTVVNVNKSTGQVDPLDIMAAIRPNTVLVCVMLANNLTGIIMPIKEIAGLVQKHRETQKTVLPFLLSDTAQAIGKIPVDVSELRVDYLSIAGHKFYGPRNGALYVRGLGGAKGCPLTPLMYGGCHEKGYRPGTENVGMIAGLGMASALVVDNIHKYQSHMESVRDYMETLLKETFNDKLHINGCHSGVPRLPNTCNMAVCGTPYHRLEVSGRLGRSMVSTGPACKSSAFEPSPVLLAFGIPREIALNSLRVCVGRNTSKEDVEVFVKDLKQAVESLSSS